MRIIYTDTNAAHVIDGNIHEVRNRDLTEEERLRKLNAIKFETLPLDLAVKVQRGNGKRVLAMFSDPYCPACRQFERNLAKIDDITVYVFMYPVIRLKMIIPRQFGARRSCEGLAGWPHRSRRFPQASLAAPIRSTMCTSFGASPA